MSKVPHPPSTVKPDNSELWALAETLGIELPQEKSLLWIVRSAMKAELPAGWIACKTPEDVAYYFNERTGQSLWFRPITAANHELVKQARAGQVTDPNAGLRASGVSRIASLTSSAATTPTASTLPATSSHPAATSAYLSKTAPSSSTPSAANSRPLSKRASGENMFSLETQQALLSGMTPAQIKQIGRIQKFFRRWREKKQKIIKAKVRIGRATMDMDMMARLALGKRRTIDKNNPSEASPTAAKLALNMPPGKVVGALTVPSTPNSSYPQSRTPAAGSDNPLDPVEKERAAKRTASMLKMLAIQQRFGVDGKVNGVEIIPSAAQTAVPSSRATMPATSASIAATAPVAPAEDDTDRRGMRLNNRRRTFHDDHNAFSSSSSSSSNKPRQVVNGRSTTLRNWQFISMVVKLQKKFRKHREALRAKVASKVQNLKSLQVSEADRKLRRASLPLSDLNAIRNRLSSGVPAAAQNLFAATAAPAKN